MNLKETSRTGLQLFCRRKPAEFLPRPGGLRLGPPQCCSVFKDHFRPQLSSPAFPLRLSVFSRPLLRGGPAFYLVSFPPSRTFLFFLSGFFSLRRPRPSASAFRLQLRSSGDEARIYSIHPSQVNYFFLASDVFFLSIPQPACFRAVDCFRLPSRQLLAYNEQAENDLHPAFAAAVKRCGST